MKKIVTIAIACSCFLLIVTGCAGKQTADEFSLSQTILTLNRESGSGTRTSFLNFLDLSETELPEDSADTVSGTDVMLAAVESEPYAIGYVSQSNLTEKVKVLSVDGVSPKEETVKSGAYPFARNFYLVTKASATEVVQDLLSFIETQDEQIEALGYIAIHNKGDYSSQQPKGIIKISGSSSVYPLINALAENYRHVNPNAEIEINQTDSDNGIENISTGISDIAMSSRELTEEEAVDTNCVTIAKDTIAVIVNRKNPVTDISTKQLKSVYLKTITTWDKMK